MFVKTINIGHNQMRCFLFLQDFKQIIYTIYKQTMLAETVLSLLQDSPSNHGCHKAAIGKVNANVVNVNVIFTPRRPKHLKTP